MADLTPEELERIEYRLSWKRGYPGSRDDARKLVAEVRRLREQLGQRSGDEWQRDIASQLRTALASVDEERAARKDAEAEIERLRERLQRSEYAPCAVCAGSKRLLTGESCGICSGTGLESQEIVGLRLECWKARNACDEAKRKADDHRRQRDEARDDLALLAQLRAHPALDAVLRVVAGGSGSYAECAALLLRLLRGEP